ncbi:exocyst complex component 8 isoform X2 [Culicoides brevitarsis]
MYQLSHMLIDQKNMLSTLKEEISVNANNVCGDQSHKNDEEESSTIVESLIGFEGTLKGKTLISEGGLIEIDSTDYRPIVRVHLLLFNDLLIISKIKHNNKLVYLNQYDIKKLAIINIRDRDGIKNALNLMTMDGSRIFQCISAAAKIEWMEKFDLAIKFNQRKEKIIKGNNELPISKKSSNCSTDIQHAPDWVIYSSEEINAELTQRHFEDAFSLIQRTEDYLTNHKINNIKNLDEIHDKIRYIKRKLASDLLRELSNIQSGNLPVRICRRPLKILIEMGKSREACGNFLRVCTMSIRSSQRQARRNNLSISDLFFCDVAQVASEFLRAFKNNMACTSALVVWCNSELKYFVSQLVKHYLTKGTPLENIAIIVESIRVPCYKLTELGINLTYHMEGLLRSTLHYLLEECKRRIIETIERSEDICQPCNLHSKSNLQDTIKEFALLGIDIQMLVTGETWINLSQTTLNFCRNFINITDSCALLAKNESIKFESENLLKEIFIAQFQSKPNMDKTVDLNFVTSNKTFLVNVLLKTALTRFTLISGKLSYILKGVEKQLTGPKPKARNIYKTEIL